VLTTCRSTRWGVLTFAALAAAAIGCSILDPLEGISDGAFHLDATPEAGGTVDSAIVEAARVPQEDAASSPQDVATLPACPAEPEPNDDNARTLPPGTTVEFCGTIDAVDSDIFVFQAVARKAYAIELEFPTGTTAETVEISGPDGSTNMQVTNQTISYDRSSSAGGPVYFRVRTTQATPQEYKATIRRP